MELDELVEALKHKGVDRVCPACGVARVGGVTTADLGGTFVGITCAHCGHVRLFHEETLTAPED